MSDSLSGNFAEAARRRDSLLKYIGKNREALDERPHAKEIAELKRISSYSFSDAYQASRDRYRAHLCDTLAALPGLRDTAVRWGSLSQSQRLKFLNACLAEMNRPRLGAGHSSFLPNLIWEHNRNGNAAEFRAYFDDRAGRKDTIALNSHPQALNTETLSQALSNLVKQQRYIYQASLARAFRHGGMEGSHPLYNDAKTLSDLYRQDGVIDRRILSAWMSQPHEEDAAGLATAVRYFVERFEPVKQGDRLLTRIRNGTEQWTPYPLIPPGKR